MNERARLPFTIEIFAGAFLNALSCDIGPQLGKKLVVKNMCEKPNVLALIKGVKGKQTERQNGRVFPSTLKPCDATQIGEETVKEIHVRTYHRLTGIKEEVANGQQSNHVILTGHKINLEIAKLLGNGLLIQALSRGT